MVKSSPLATQIALSGAARVRAGEIPELKNARNLSKLHGEQNIDFFEESFGELQSRDNADGQVSMHIFSAGPDQDASPGKVKLDNLEAEYEGTTQNGSRYSLEDRGEAQKIKVHRFEENQVVVFESTVNPGEEVNSSVLILDRQNPENSIIGNPTSDWLLGL